LKSFTEFFFTGAVQRGAVPASGQSRVEEVLGFGLFDSISVLPL
jgi:hypothetical protein